MIRIKLRGHDYRYEVYQILSLFYSKSEIVFSDNEYDIESIYDSILSHAECRIPSKGISKKICISSEDSKNIKNSLKMTLLKVLEECTGVTMPWGILVGIRPTKIIHEYLNNGIMEEEIAEHLIKGYSLSVEKCRLAIEVAKNEARFLDKATKAASIYVGIPFCPTRCVYCSFTSNPIGGNSGLVDSYVDCLIKEITSVLSFMKRRNCNIDTFYIGGGTPTSLNENQLHKLLSSISSCLSVRDLREVTIEAGRPDSITMDKLSIIKDFGCSRISINPQTMNDETLKMVGRNHTSADVVEKYNMAREAGFDNINMDIIIGLPGEGREEIKKTMSRLYELAPDSITIHTMAIKRASILNEREFMAKNSTAGIMYDIASDEVRKMGMFPYYMYRQKNMVVPLENVGYCREGKECIYNVQMIAENISIASFGADAITKIVYDEENRIERQANVKDVREYINRIDEMIEKKLEALNTLPD